MGCRARFRRAPTSIVLVVATLATSVAYLGPAAVASSSCGTGSAVTEGQPIRVAAAKSALADVRGRRFSPDADYASGGSLMVSGSAVSGTSSPQLYTHMRRGVRGYAFPVATSGTYFVDLFVSEPDASAGQRVWRVSAEGTPATKPVDVASAVGTRRAWHVMFATPVTDGCLDLRVMPLTGLPLVGSVTVAYESAATTRTTNFDDEFTGSAGSSPSSTRWGYAYGGNGWGNNEQQSYTDRPANVALDGAGQLDITAQRETYTGYDGHQRQFTSARLTTRNTFTFQYGTATARLEAPKGDGLLSAFWAMGTDVDQVGWPACGETDIIENRGHQPGIVDATIHAATNHGSAWLSSATRQEPQSNASGPHVYTLIWGPDAIESEVDGQAYMSISASDIPRDDNWPFNHPFFMLLSLAVGGNWAGNPDSTTQFPAHLVVDYVRVQSS